MVLTRDAGTGRNYDDDPFDGLQEAVDQGDFAFPVTADLLDDRLSNGQMVIGVEINGQHHVYPLERDGIANDTIEGTPVLIVTNRSGPAGWALSPVVDGQTLDFQRVGDVLVDTGTGSRWTLDGEAIDGDFIGTTLESLPLRTAFWFAYVGAFPDAVVMNVMSTSAD